MADIEERVVVLEKDMAAMKTCVDANLTGERSVWAALEKLTTSINDFEKASESDRAGIREIVHCQAIESAKMSTAYAGMAGILKGVGVAIIVSVLGVLVGLLTHTITLG